MLICLHCTLADQEREWYEDDEEHWHIRYHPDSATTPVLLYGVATLCVEHFNLTRGYPAHGLGPLGDRDEIEAWRADQRVQPMPEWPDEEIDRPVKLPDETERPDPNRRRWWQFWRWEPPPFPAP